MTAYEEAVALDPGDRAKQETLAHVYQLVGPDARERAIAAHQSRSPTIPTGPIPIWPWPSCTARQARPTSAGVSPPRSGTSRRTHPPSTSCSSAIAPRAPGQPCVRSPTRPGAGCTTPTRTRASTIRSPSPHRSWRPPPPTTRRTSGSRSVGRSTFSRTAASGPARSSSSPERWRSPSPTSTRWTAKPARPPWSMSASAPARGLPCARAPDDAAEQLRSGLRFGASLFLLAPRAIPQGRLADPAHLAQRPGGLAGARDAERRVAARGRSRSAEGTPGANDASGCAGQARRSQPRPRRQRGADRHREVDRRGRSVGRPAGAGADRGARCGLSGDLQRADSALDDPAHRRMADLVAFSVSDDYFAVRRQLGLAIA